LLFVVTFCFSFQFLWWWFPCLSRWYCHGLGRVSVKYIYIFDIYSTYTTTTLQHHRDKQGNRYQKTEKKSRK
jgi:hypothetical protein